MMTTCRDHSDDKVGITAIFDFRYYSWSSEHQDYECNTLALTTISWKWISFVLPCFKHASSGDRQCITLSESLWTMNTFLVTNESQVCELCVSMFRNNDIGLYSSIKTSHIVPQSNRNQPNDANWMRPHSGTLWHICEDVMFCKNENILFNHIVFSYKTKLLFNRV